MSVVEDEDITRGRAVGVDIQRAGKVFVGGVEALCPVDLTIPPGQFVSIVGPSGCGKSTLLRIIAGLESPTTGTIAIDGQPAGRSEHREGAAFVFQDAHLLPWRSLVRNVELPLELMGMPRAQRRRSAIEAIDRVGIADAAGRFPMQLSGGMRMRASLARALVSRPRLLLLDEPFAALDEFTREKLDEQLLDLWQLSQLTVLFVTHSIAEAVFLSQRVIVLSPRPGRILADLTIDLGRNRTSQTRASAEFIQMVQHIQASMRSGG